MEPITRENYRDYEAVNYSKLKTLDDHPQKLLEEREMNDGMHFGNALDMLIFEPEKFDEHYYVADTDNLPTKNVKSIIEGVIEKHGPDGITDEAVLAEAREQDYGSNWNDSTRIKKILHSGGGARYATMLAQAETKTIISIEDHMDLTKGVDTLQNHEWTAPWITEELDDRYERLTQVPLVNDLGHKFKCLLDLVIVDHQEQKIYPVDLKFTSSDTKYFDSQFVKFKYYLQAGLYTSILRSLAQDSDIHDVDVTEFTPLTFDPAEYEVENFRFIVISSRDLQHPLVYHCTDNDIYCGIHGGITRRGRKVKGALDLADEYVWHQKNDLWEYPYEAYSFNGDVRIDVFQ